MTRFLALLRNRWLILLVGGVLASTALWLLGPLLTVGGTRPLATAMPFLLPVAPLAVLVAFALSRLRAATSARALATALERQAGAGPGAQPQAELNELDLRLRDAVGRLKQTAGGRPSRYLYQIPWYIIIGPPGAGKTTLLKNAGLKFPADIAQEIRGVGGTRNCDWWFSDDAVLLDTAGRYTTQDSQEAADSAAWLGFLDLLKTHRRHQPVNGVLVAISLGDLLRFTEQERHSHGLAIRSRIQELENRLGLRLPVYVLITKCDLLAGFSEYFDDLGRDERAQIWGHTFAFDDGRQPQSPLDTFPVAFDALTARLGERVIDRIHGETDIARRGAILGFPQQFGGLGGVLGEFLDVAFRASRYERRPLLRGVYFTSATQVGNPIDRLMGSIAATFGLRAAPPDFTGRGRAYFLTRLLHDVVFAEAGMAGHDVGVVRRQRALRLAAIAASVLLALGASGLFGLSFHANRRMLAEVEGAAEAYRQTATTTDAASAPWPRLAALLDQARTLPWGVDHVDDSVPLIQTFGLDQSRRLLQPVADVYHRALIHDLQPRLMDRLDHQLRGNLGNEDILFAGLPVYLMLGGDAALEPGPFTHWFNDVDFGHDWVAPDQAALRQSLAGHVTALAAGELADLPGDKNLALAARDALKRVLPADRVLALVVNSPAAARLSAWTLAEKAGIASGQVFLRRSGKTLNDGIAGIYTRDGFHRVVLPQLHPTSVKVLREQAQTGNAAARTADDDLERQAAALDRQVLDLYYAKYEQVWDSLLGDVTIARIGSADRAAEILRILGGSTSPLRQFILAVVAETQLTQPPADMAAPAVKATGAAALPATDQDQRLGQSLHQGAAAEPGQVRTARPGQAVEDHFSGLRQMTENRPSQLDAVVDDLARLYGQSTRLSDVGSGGAAALGGDGNVAVALANKARLMPQPFASLLGSVAERTKMLTADEVQKQLNGLWQANVLPYCRQVTADRYPFVRGSSLDVPMDDFTRLFSPTGLMAQFFTTNLVRYADVSRHPWRWQKLDGAELGLGGNTLAMFEQAKAIGDAFFANGSTPQFSFEVVPTVLDSGVSQAVLDINGQRLTYSNGPQIPQRLQWPGAGTGSLTVLSLSPPLAGQVSEIAKDGPWGLFRLLEDSHATLAGERFTAALAAGPRTASFEFRTGSVSRPFDLDTLRRFRCPERL